MKKSTLNVQKVTLTVYAVLFLVAFLLMDAHSSRNDPDTFWHIEVGREMIAQGKVINTAIHTFAGNDLPYVPHEAGFQWMVGGLYELGGWTGVHGLTLMSVFLLCWGLYRLMEVSRMEAGLPRMHPFLLYIALPLIMYVIYLAYFKIRPQMVSAGLIVWFAVWLRRFSMEAAYGKAVILGLISLAVANIHTGVWVVLPVLLAMQLLERGWQRKLGRYDLAVLLLVAVGGIANVGGWRSLVYFWTLSGSPFTHRISEWSPVAFADNAVSFAALIVFVLAAMGSIRRGLFRFLLFVGMMYLGLASYKQFLYLLLFLPYYLAVVVDHWRWMAVFQPLEPYLRLKTMLWLLTAGLLLNFASTALMPYKQPVIRYPVQEMNYILQKVASPERPKVLSTYASSGYVSFRGGDVLADGRFDPFISEATRGIHQWTAFERSANGFGSGYLMEVIREDRPDFLIIPAADPKESATSVSAVGLDEVKRQLPAPDFFGSFGEVWDLRGFYR